MNHTHTHTKKKHTHDKSQMSNLSPYLNVSFPLRQRKKEREIKKSNAHQKITLISYLLAIYILKDSDNLCLIKESLYIG